MLAGHPAVDRRDRPAGRRRQDHRRRWRRAPALAAESIFVTDGMRRPDAVRQGAAGQARERGRHPGRLAVATGSGATWFNDAFAAFAPTVPNLLRRLRLRLRQPHRAGGRDGQDRRPEQSSSTRWHRRAGTASSCRNFPDCAPVLADGRNIDLNGASGRIELLPETGDATLRHVRRVRVRARRQGPVGQHQGREPPVARGAAIADHVTPHAEIAFSRDTAPIDPTPGASSGSRHDQGRGLGDQLLDRGDHAGVERGRTRRRSPTPGRTGAGRRRPSGRRGGRRTA